MAKKIPCSLLILTVLLCSFQLIFINSSASPKPASPTTLKWGQYINLNQRCDYSIEWSFSGSNPDVGLLAYIMDEANFLRFVNLETFIAYTLSDGKYYSKSGTLNVDHDDSWYFVVLNLDDSQLSTNVEMNATFKSSQTYIIGIVLVIALVGICLLIYHKSRKPTTTIINQPYVNQVAFPQNPSSQMIYCQKCGSSLTIGIKFCPKCGTEVVYQEKYVLK